MPRRRADSALAELEPAAYAPGTPEERNLRLDTRYIAPDGATVLVGALSLLLGVIVTFVLALAPVYALAHAWGWLLRWQGVAVPSGNHAVTAHVSAIGWWLCPAILTGATLAALPGLVAAPCTRTRQPTRPAATLRGGSS